MVRALAFTYNHKLKVLTTILAIKFGLAVSNSIDAYSLSCAHCAASAKNIFILRKRICTIELDDSYVEELGCPLFPLLLKFTTELLPQASVWSSPQNAQRFLSFKKG
jgi:hypothetical protein